MKKATKNEFEEVKQVLLHHYSSANTELKFANDFELLIAIILSAQCTDKRVNIITPSLFEKYPNPKSLAEADLEDIKEIIGSCSFFNNKAKNIIKMAQDVCEKYDGNIPRNQTDLISLAGVGQKTANVFMIEIEGKNLMAVDTHVFRVSHRLGLSSAKTALKTEEELSKKFKTDLNILHQALVLFGRYICKAVKPECEKCLFPNICKSKNSFKPS